MKACPKCGRMNEDDCAICVECETIIRKRPDDPKIHWEKIIRVLLITLAVLLLVSGIAGYVLYRTKQVPPPPAPAPAPAPAQTEAPTVPEETEEPTVAETEEETKATDTTEETRGPKEFDDRVADYSAENPVWQTLTFEWIAQNGTEPISLEIQVDQQMYLYYRSLQRYYGIENLHLYINDSHNQKLIRSIVDGLRDVASERAYDDSSVAREIVKFVQDTIEYQYDSDTTGREEYPRYPVETLYEKQGDCEDTSILMAALLKEWGYEVGLLHLPGHAAVAIRTSDTYNATAYYEIDGHRYLFIESTGSGWSIGEIPDEFLEAGAELYIVP